MFKVLYIINYVSFNFNSLLSAYNNLKCKYYLLYISFYYIYEFCPYCETRLETDLDNQINSVKFTNCGSTIQQIRNKIMFRIKILLIGH